MRCVVQEDVETNICRIGNASKWFGHNMGRKDVCKTRTQMYKVQVDGKLWKYSFGIHISTKLIIIIIIHYLLLLYTKVGSKVLRINGHV